MFAQWIAVNVECDNSCCFGVQKIDEQNAGCEAGSGVNPIGFTWLTFSDCEDNTGIINVLSHGYFPEEV